MNIMVLGSKKKSDKGPDVEFIPAEPQAGHIPSENPQYLHQKAGNSNCPSERSHEIVPNNGAQDPNPSSWEQQRGYMEQERVDLRQQSNSGTVNMDLNPRGESELKPPPSRSYLHHLEEEHWKQSQIIKELNDDLIRTKASAFEHRNANIKLLQDITTLKSNLKSFELSFQSLQEQAFERNSTNRRWQAPPDFKIDDSIRDLEKAIRDWSKLHAVKAIDIADPTERTSFFHHLKIVARVEKASNLASKLSETEQGHATSAVALSRLLLSALLSDYVYNTIIMNPFFSSHTYDNSPLEAPSSYLLAMYNDLTKANPKAAHQWRLNLTRMLNAPKTSVSTQPEIALAQQTSKKLNHLYNELTKSFKSSPARFLIHIPDAKEVRDHLSKDLRYIMNLAGELSITLWAQYPCLKMRGMEQLGNEPFSITSSIVEAHRSHKLDEDDHSLDGRPISIVLFPYVAMYGDYDGEDYDHEFRVLSKAQVYLTPIS